MSDEPQTGRESMIEERPLQLRIALAEHVQAHSKNLITLDTACILLIVTLLERLFPNPEWKALIGVGMVAFLFSILSALFLHMGITAWLARSPDDSDNTFETTTGVFSIMTFFGFLTGLVMLSVFTLKNLY